MIDKRRLNLAIGASVGFGIVAILDFVIFLTHRRESDLILALAFAVLTLLWAIICVKWSRQR